MAPCLPPAALPRIRTASQWIEKAAREIAGSELDQTALAVAARSNLAAAAVNLRLLAQRLAVQRQHA